MGFFFTRYQEGEDYGFIYFVRPSYLARRQYQQVSMDRVTILDNEGSWFGAFYYETDGADRRHLRTTLVFFGTRAQVGARMGRQFQGFARNYHVRPLKVIKDEKVIQLVNCRYCKGQGKTESPPLFEYLEPTVEVCAACDGTCVEEQIPTEERV